MTEVYLCSGCAKGLDANQPVMKKRDSVCDWCGNVGVLLLYDAERATPIWDEVMKEEVSESIPEETSEITEEVTEEESVTITEEPADVTEAVSEEEEIESIEETLDILKDPEYADLQPENSTKDIDEQIAELQARKAKAEAKKK